MTECHYLGWPAGMQEKRAAAYLDRPITTFRNEVMPNLPVATFGKVGKRYRRKDLDAWLDRQAGIDAGATVENV